MRNSRGFTTFMSTERGFTLVELLVVITIIAVLSAIAMVSYSNVLKTSRDSKRLSDLKLIQSALEEYHADQIYYPDEGLNLANDTSITNCSGNVSTCTVTRTYLNQIPKDPLSNQSYCFRSMISSSQTGNNCGFGWYSSYSSRCQYYHLCATLERPGTPTPCSCPPVTGNYKAIPP